MKNKTFIHLMFFGLLISLATRADAQTKTSIVKDSLPQQIKEHLHGKYHDYSVSNIIMNTDNKGAITYKLEARKTINTSLTIVYDLVYDESGKLISKHKEKEIYYTGNEPVKQKPVSNDGHNHQH